MSVKMEHYERKKPTTKWTTTSHLNWMQKNSGVWLGFDVFMQ